MGGPNLWDEELFSPYTTLFSALDPPFRQTGVTRQFSVLFAEVNRM